MSARGYFARTDDELRQVRDWAQHGIAQHGDLPADIPRWQAERPWQWSTTWFDAAWLRGAIAYLDWIRGDTPVTPVSRQPKPISPHLDLRFTTGWRANYGVGAGRYDIEEEIHEYAQTGLVAGARRRGTCRSRHVPAAAMVRGGSPGPLLGDGRGRRASCRSSRLRSVLPLPL